MAGGGLRVRKGSSTRRRRARTLAAWDGSRSKASSERPHKIGDKLRIFGHVADPRQGELDHLQHEAGAIFGGDSTQSTLQHVHLGCRMALALPEGGKDLLRIEFRAAEQGPTLRSQE